MEAEGADEIDPAAGEGVVGEEPIGREGGEEIFGIGDKRGVRWVRPWHRAAVEPQFPRGLEPEADHPDPASKRLMRGKGPQNFAKLLVSGGKRVELGREHARASGQFV